MNRRQFIRRSSATTLSVAGISLSGCTGHSDPGEIESYLDDTHGWDSDKSPDKNIIDKTDLDHIPITVGTGPDYRSFSPVAVKISQGTTVTWVWTGRGGIHNVKAARISQIKIKSGPPKQSGVFTHTFESSGDLFYFCDRHYSENMRGVIIILPPKSGAKVTNSG